MASYTYTHAYATLRIEQLIAECVAAGLPVTDVQTLGDPSETIYVITSVALTTGEQTTLTNTVNAHVGAPLYTQATLSSGNALINTVFLNDTRGRLNTNVADATYSLDRWYHLSQSNPVLLDRGVPASAGVASYGKLRQPNASAQRYGLAQAIEYSSTYPLRNRIASFQFKAATGTSLPIRAALLYWPGAQDAVTRDVVNNWTSTTFSPGNFYISTV